jgi:hypothetical protein
LVDSIHDWFGRIDGAIADAADDRARDEAGDQADRVLLHQRVDRAAGGEQDQYGGPQPRPVESQAWLHVAATRSPSTPKSLAASARIA